LKQVFFLRNTGVKGALNFGVYLDIPKYLLGQATWSARDTTILMYYMYIKIMQWAWLEGTKVKQFSAYGDAPPELFVMVLSLA